MNNKKVKELILSLKGKSLIFKVNIGRNKSEKFEGIIENLYPSLFTVRTNGILKSFTYSDVLTKDLVFKEINFM